MATRAFVADRLTEFSRQVVWTGLLLNDDGAPHDRPEFQDRTFQATGTFGGATVAMQGSNDGTNWFAITTLSGTALSFTAAGGGAAGTGGRYIRPLVTGGDGTTSLTVTALLVSRTAYRGTPSDTVQLADGTAAVPSLGYQAEPSTGLYRVAAGTLAVVALGAEVTRFANPASAANRFAMYGAIAGQQVSLNSEGTDANISMQVYVKGAARWYVNTGNGAAGGFGSYAPSSVNGVTIMGSAAASPVAIYPEGADTNIGLSLIPKGTGALMAAVPDAAITGGNARGANAVDWQTTRTTAVQVASGANAVVGGGTANTASGSFSTIAGGQTNSATAILATVGGGVGNIANSSSSWVPGGDRATTRNLIGRGAWASGQFATTGDAQSGEFVLRRQTTDATVTRMTADNAAAGTANTVNLPNLGTFRVKLLVVGRQTGGAAGTVGDSASWEANVLIKRGASAAAAVFVGGTTLTSAPAIAAITAGTAFAPGINDAAAAAWRLTLDVDTTNGGLAVSVTGEVSKNINWVARALSVEAVG